MFILDLVPIDILSGYRDERWRSGSLAHFPLAFGLVQVVTTSLGTHCLSRVFLMGMAWRGREDDSWAIQINVNVHDGVTNCPSFFQSRMYIWVQPEISE